MDFCYNLLDPGDVRLLLNSDIYPDSHGLESFQALACDTSLCNNESAVGTGFCVKKSEDEVGRLDTGFDFARANAPTKLTPYPILTFTLNIFQLFL